MQPQQQQQLAINPPPDAILDTDDPRVRDKYINWKKMFRARCTASGCDAPIRYRTAEQYACDELDIDITNSTEAAMQAEAQAELASYIDETGSGV